MLSQLAKTPRGKWVLSLVLVLLVLLFGNALNDARVASANKARKIAFGAVSMADSLQLNNVCNASTCSLRLSQILFRAQRNSYLSGMCLLMAIVLWRTLSLQARIDETKRVVRSPPATHDD